MAAVAPIQDTSRGNRCADATRLLYERHGQRIFGFCLSRLRDRQEAEDAVQNTFIYAFRLLERGVVPDAELPWLFTIARNVCRSRRRSLWRRGRVETATDLDAMQDALSAPVTSAPDELYGLSDALAAMPETQRRALLLREWQGLSYAEIGQTLGLSQSAVETLLFRARRSLANRLTTAADKVAVMLNGFVLLRLGRRFLRGSLGAKTAAAAAAVGLAAGAAVPLERTLRQPQPRAPVANTSPTPAPVGEPARVARVETTAPMTVDRQVATATSPQAHAVTPNASSASPLAPPVARSDTSQADAPARIPADPAAAAATGSVVGKASHLVRAATTSPILPALPPLPALPQPQQLGQAVSAATQTVSAVSAALDLPPLPVAPVAGATGSAPLPGPSPDQTVSSVKNTVSTATTQLAGGLPIKP